MFEFAAGGQGSNNWPNVRQEWSLRDNSHALWSVLCEHISIVSSLFCLGPKLILVSRSGRARSTSGQSRTRVIARVAVNSCNGIVDMQTMAVSAREHDQIKSNQIRSAQIKSRIKSDQI